MGRFTIPPHEPLSVVAGWDAPLDTYFAHLVGPDGVVDDWLGGAHGECPSLEGLMAWVLERCPASGIRHVEWRLRLAADRVLNDGTADRAALSDLMQHHLAAAGGDAEKAVAALVATEPRPRTPGVWDRLRPHLDG